MHITKQLDVSPSWICISIARLGLEQGRSILGQVYYNKSQLSFSPHWHCQWDHMSPSSGRVLFEGEAKFPPNLHPRLMAWKTMRKVCQLISGLEIHSSRISKVEAIYRCWFWECSDNVSCISQRRNALFLQTTPIFVCLFVFNFTYCI